MAESGPRPRTLESRRADGEPLEVLPLVVGGRPTEADLARPPAGMNRYARAAWHEVVPLLVAAKLIDRVDSQQLESYCMQVGRARALREAIEWEHDGKGRRVRQRTLEEQFVTKTQRGFTSNPLLSQEREAWREARMLAESLGLNPVGRTRLVGRKPQRTGLAALQAGLPHAAKAG